MKKITAIVLLTAFLLALPVFASEKSTMEQLFQKWEAEGYPDYVCGVWLTYGGGSSEDPGTTVPELAGNARFNVSVVSGSEGERGREEILSLVSDGDSILFHEGKYPRNVLVREQDAIMHRFMKAFPRESVSCGVDEPENYLDFTIYRGKNIPEGSETNVDLTVNDFDGVSHEIVDERYEERIAELEKFGEELQKEYGDMIRVSYFDGTLELFYTDDAGASRRLLMGGGEVYALSEKPKSLFFLFIPLVLLAAVLVFLAVRRRAVLLPAEGETDVTADTVEAQAPALTVSPSPQTDERILDEIRRK